MVTQISVQIRWQNNILLTRYMWPLWNHWRNSDSAGLIIIRFQRASASACSNSSTERRGQPTSCNSNRTVVAAAELVVSWNIHRHLLQQYVGLFTSTVGDNLKLYVVLLCKVIKLLHIAIIWNIRYHGAQSINLYARRPPKSLWEIDTKHTINIIFHNALFALAGGTFLLRPCNMLRAINIMHWQ